MMNIVYMCIPVAAVPWYNICIVLQIDQFRYFITVLTIFISYKRNARQSTHCMHLHVAALPWYNICIVLPIDQCRNFITVLTIVMHYKAEMKLSRRILNVILKAAK